jgi:GDSL-like Lipase/Acylhydrolase family
VTARSHRLGDTSSAITLTPDDGPPVWRGCVEWVRHGGWWQPWRLPVQGFATAHAPELEARASMPAGVRAMLRTDATALTIDIATAGDEVSPLDVTVDGQLWDRRPLDAGVATVHVSLPEGTKPVEVWLPQRGTIQIGPLTLKGATTVEPLHIDAFRWITYGSSITHCAGAPGPSETWPALVARQHDWDLLCLGFGGECHLDPLVARTIAQTPADLISLCLGINIAGAASFSRRTLGAHISWFIETIREAQPVTPIVVISPIASPTREETPNAVGLSLADVREIVTEASVALQRLGDARLHLVDGLEILGIDDAHLLPDGLHPGPAGYRLMAGRLGRRLPEVSTCAQQKA